MNLKARDKSSAGRHFQPYFGDAPKTPEVLIRCDRTHLSSSSLLVTPTMAAAISALNAKIRSQPVLNYVCSTRTSNTPPSALPETLQSYKTNKLPSSTRLLGPSLQLRHPHRRRHGHAERSRNVPAPPIPSRSLSLFSPPTHLSDSDDGDR